METGPSLKKYKHGEYGLSREECFASQTRLKVCPLNGQWSSAQALMEICLFLIDAQDLRETFCFQSHRLQGEL
ncbi:MULTISPECIES: hypothetical protein [Delftia]|uniref:hypothetical protein n=1 Tax=Delftia TaxID=80865 RepID=UPI000B287787|nr:hypothetical protein [Delftia lacustris]